MPNDCFLLGLILNRKRSPFAFSLSFRWDRKASPPIIALSASYHSMGYHKHRNRLLQKNALRERLLPALSLDLSQSVCRKQRSKKEEFKAGEVNLFLSFF
ncbi:hypothetical protein L1987_64670 [Smallanthus sonchifolius]|uniref:Uncharacterized protein n=1 Tax=Smallanthus sonchifolius TaxID=185202 RepID=A0ACB9BSE3_9ASTR|nr:hypothetical protein L1987_64670 [Smallanthus sonchifolius]